MVDLALSSIALAVYSRTQQHPLAATEASSRYYRLLRVAQERIAQLGIPTLDERNIDACLLAFFLMGRFEGATHRPSDLNSKESFTWLHNFSHHDGAMLEYTLKALKDLKDQRIRLVFSLMFSSHYTATILCNPV
jgi:hypothetical protein